MKKIHGFVPTVNNLHPHKTILTYLNLISYKKYKVFTFFGMNYAYILTNSHCEECQIDEY